MAGFNWGSVDWGSVANAAASYYGSQQAAGAAKSAGKAAAAGSDASAQLGRDQFAYQQQINAPFLQSQYNALNQYNALMGLPTVSAQGGGFGAASQPQQFVTRNAQGVPVANAQLYASDPAYKAAWDATLKQHQNQWHGNGYWHGSDSNWIESNLRSRLPSGWGQQPASTQPQMTQQQAFDAFRNAPGYQFGFNQGQNAIETGAAARGGLFSGAAAKALAKFGTDYADQQGFTPYMNRIASAAGIGQTNPVGNLQAASGNFASGVGASMQNAANARSSGLLSAAQANLWGMGQAGGFLNDAYGYYKNGGR